MKAPTTGIYGSALLDFPERFLPFSWWKATANFNDGWTPVGQPVFLRGIFNNDLSGIKNSNGNTASYSHYFLWCQEDLDDGDFITWNGVNYRILHDNDWTSQNGFTQYIINKVVGSDGPTNLDPGFSNGGGKM